MLGAFMKSFGHPKSPRK